MGADPDRAPFAANFSTSGSIFPDSAKSAPQVSKFKIGFLQNVMWGHSTIISYYGSPKVTDWKDIPVGGTTIVGQTATYKQILTGDWLDDTGPNLDLLFDKAGVPDSTDAQGHFIKGTNDPNSLVSPLNCTDGKIATTHDNIQIYSDEMPPSLTVTYSGGITVVYTFTRVIRKEDFRLFCVAFNTVTKEICPLAETTWSLNIDSSVPNQQITPSGQFLLPAQDDPSLSPAPGVNDFHGTGAPPLITLTH